MINVGPGQRETIKGGRDQDLLTPFWQTLALCFCGVMILGWLAAISLVLGAILGYALSLIVLVLRCAVVLRRYRDVPWLWVGVNLLIHCGVAFWLDLNWTSYVMPWSPWQKMWFVLISAAMAAPFGVFAYVIAVRLFDPNYPSPRKAVEQRQPQMPWYRDRPVAAPTELIPRLVRVQVENNGHNYHAGVLDLPPVREWYDFAAWLLAHPDKFSEPNAKRHKVKVDLKSKRPPWYGRGFRQVRDDLFAREWAEWANSSAHEQGIVLHEEALAAFHEFCESGPPLLDESG